MLDANVGVQSEKGAAFEQLGLWTGLVGERVPQSGSGLRSELRSDEMRSGVGIRMLDWTSGNPDLAHLHHLKVGRYLPGYMGVLYYLVD